MSSVTSRRYLLSGVLALLCGCTSTIGDLQGSESDPAAEDSEPSEGSADPATPPQGGANDAPQVSAILSESNEIIVNPERGFYTGIDLIGAPGSAAELRSQGYTLAIALVRLDDYRNQALDAQLLQDIARGLQSVRAAGIKVILRFTYNASFTDDAPKSRILQHIGQLEQVFAANSDVIAFVQAGFIGAWGEWHGSTHGLDNDGDRIEILQALLDAIPANRTVQVRTPMYKAAGWPGALSEEEAHGSSDKARIGHHNDCFLASDSDYGTYAAPVNDWRDYVAADTQFTAMGGETCALNQPRSGCDSALQEMADHHWTYLNRDYRQEVISDWVKDGCDEDIRRQLGYRLSLSNVTYSESVAPGGSMFIRFDVANSGFSSLVNPRPVKLALTGSDGTRHVVDLETDPRRWKPGTTTTVSRWLRVPADLAPGNSSLSLWLPDAAEGLQADSRYAVRLANAGRWSSTTGDNLLFDDLVIDPDNSGEVDTSAATLSVLK